MKFLIELVMLIVIYLCLNDLINDCNAKLKRGKSGGNIGFNSNHLVHGWRRIRVLLSMLFNAMIVHGHYPSELLKSTIVSIPKDKTASLSNSDNYEAFLCSTVFIDYLIMLLLIYVAILCKQVICSMVIRIIIQRCLLDASKAFDKISYGKLFSTLLLHNINIYCIRLIVDSYVRQISRVSWGNHLSQDFELSTRWSTFSDSI